MPVDAVSTVEINQCATGLAGTYCFNHLYYNLVDSNQLYCAGLQKNLNGKWTDHDRQRSINTIPSSHTRIQIRAVGMPQLQGSPP